MKRYRVFNFDFDARASWLKMEIKDEWEELVKEQHRINQELTRQGLLEEYGSHFSEQKLQDFIDLGVKPISIIAFHNKFTQQLRDAFVVGGYYPALTAACALGERILNHLLLLFRDDFRGTPEYKTVYRKGSFDNWQLAISTLDAWKILTPDTVIDYYRLANIRNRAIHFNPATDANDRVLALEAIQLLNTIIANQFGAFGTHWWFIPDTPGATYIKKEAELLPFIQRVYLPNCFLVGSKHYIEFVDGKFLIHDNHQYEDREITDDEFRLALLNR